MREAAGSRYGQTPWGKAEAADLTGAAAPTAASAARPAASAEGASKEKADSRDLMEHPSNWPAKTFTRDELENRLDSLQAEPPRPDDPVLALAAAQLVESGKLDDARALVCAGAADGAVQQNAAQSMADRLCGALGQSVGEADRAAVAAQVRREASQKLLDLRRGSTLRRKLDDALWARLRAAPTTTAQATPTAVAPPPAASATDPAPAASSTDTAVGKALPSRGAPAAKAVTPAPAPAPAPPATTPPAAAPAPESVLVSILVAKADGATLEALKGLGAMVEGVQPAVGVVVARVPLDKLEALALSELVKRVELVP
jgi:hypothetical protein